MLAPPAEALARRIDSASGSMPMISAFGNALASAMHTRPEPQPTSSARPPARSRSAACGTDFIQ